MAGSLGLEGRLTRFVVEPARGLGDRLGLGRGRLGGLFARRLGRLRTVGREVAARGTERLGLLALELLLRRAVLALQLEVLLDGVVEQAHRARKPSESRSWHPAWRSARSTRFLPARFAR